MKKFALMTIIAAYLIVSIGAARAQIIDQGLMETVLDPRMDSVKEITQVRQECKSMKAALTRLEPELQGAEIRKKAKTLSLACELFLEYSDTESSNLLVNLASSDDPALAKLRGMIALPSPPGFAYVHIKRSEKRDFLYGLPALIPSVPKEEIIQPGETFLTRYITIDLGKCLVDGTDKNGRSDVETTLSHELVHVYVNSLMGFEHFDELPKWFNEGLAVYVTGDNKISKVTHTYSGEVTQTRSVCDEYKKYYLSFQYLAWLKGENSFNLFVTECIKTRRIKDLLLNYYEIRSQEHLEKAAKRWDGLNQTKYTLIAIAIGWFLLVLHLGHESGVKIVLGCSLPISLPLLAIALLWLPHLQRLIPSV